MKSKKAIDIFKKVVSEEIKSIIYKEISVSKEREKLGLLRKMFRNVFPLRIKKTFHYFLECREKNAPHFVSLNEKKLSLDFLDYVLRKDPEIPYIYFPPSDWQEIDKFIKNKFLIAIFDELDQDQIFDNQDLKRQKFYNISLKNYPIGKKRGYYEFLGYKSIVNHFDAHIFIGEYGLNYFKDKKKLIDSTIVDCGAFIGDSVYLFNQKLNPKKIIAIEPDYINYNKLLSNIHLNGMKNVIPLLKGVGEKKGFFNIVHNGGSTYLSEYKARDKTEVDTIDNLVKELKLENIGLVKMDIEGFELPAIRGAQETIKKFRPALIISLYHRGQDFFKIPKFIKELVPQYQFRFINLNEGCPIYERLLVAEY